MADDVFVIENGTTLRGYPRREECPAAFEWPNEDAQWVEAELFKAHAHFLLANREQIFADSRMFLAPVNVMSGPPTSERCQSRASGPISNGGCGAARTSWRTM